jgi:hypothetical protein
MCKTPPKIIAPQGSQSTPICKSIATVNLKHPPKDSKHPKKDSKHPKIFETPQNIRNTPKDSKHPIRFETPQNI